MTKRFDVEVSLALGADLTADPSTWSWTDISAYAEGDVEITRGRLDEQTQATASRCTVRLNNADGRFSRLNPAGAYYGQLAKNTPIRIRACATGGSLVTRFVGYVSEWPPRWTHGQKHQWVSVRADGILRRLGQGPTPPRSAIKRAVLASGPVAYWPLEDGLDAGVAGAGVPNTSPLKTVGTITFAQDDTLPGSAATPDMSQGALLGPVKGGSSTAWNVEFWLKADFSAGSRAAYILTSSSGLATWGIRQPASASGQFDVFIDDSTGSLNESLAFSVSGWTEDWHHVAITAEQDGANVNVFMYGDGALLSGTQILSETLGAVTAVAINDFDAFSFADVLSAAHLAVGDGTTFSESADAGQGHAGETDVDRFNRICTEAGLPRVTATGDGILLGPQPVAGDVTILRDGEAAGHGVLFEALTGALAYLPLSARYNLAADLELDHDNGHIVGSFEPADDDLLTRNDVTVHRTDGSFARATDEASIAASGRADMQVTLNLSTDDQLPDHASWLLHLGTVDDYRYPTVELALHKSSTLLTDWLTCDIGSRLTIDNLPANPTPNQVDQIVEGYTERINSVAYDVSINLSPYSPYDIGTWESTTNTKRYDTLLSVTAEALDTTETGVDITNSGSVQWGSSTPYVITIGGEWMTVTAVSGTGASQTLTVTRSTNGVTKSHASGVQVRMAPPHRAYRGL